MLWVRLRGFASRRGVPRGRQAMGWACRPRGIMPMLSRPHLGSRVVRTEYRLGRVRYGSQRRLEPGQSVISQGPDRDLTVAQVLAPASRAA